MRLERCKITRDVNTVYNRAVSEWELPVLQYVFDAGNVVRTGQFEVSDREYPEAASEFARLASRYGSDPQSDQPYVEIVYGQGRIGVREMEKLIKETQAAEETKPKPAKVKSAKKSGKRRASAETDSLLS